MPNSFLSYSFSSNKFTTCKLYNIIYAYYAIYACCCIRQRLSWELANGLCRKRRYNYVSIFQFKLFLSSARYFFIVHLFQTLDYDWLDYYLWEFPGSEPAWHYLYKNELLCMCLRHATDKMFSLSKKIIVLLCLFFRKCILKQYLSHELWRSQSVLWASSTFWR